MPDINEKYVIYYAVRGYRTGRNDVTISIYDTVGSAEVNAQTMKELGSTGIYYYNWQPKKRTTYLAVMDCTAYPRKSHQVIRIEKTKVSGAVTIPRAPKVWTFKSKEKLFGKITQLTELLTQFSEWLSQLQSNQKKEHQLLLQKADKSLRVSETLQKKPQSLIDNELKNLSQFKNNWLKEQTNLLEKKFKAIKSEMSTEIKKLSKFAIFEQLESLNEKITHLSLLADELTTNLNLSNDLFSGDLKEKIKSLDAHADELLIMLKNE